MQDLVVSVKFTETVDSLFTAGSEVLASSKADIPVIVATTVNAELRVGGMGCALRSRREVIVVVCVHPSQVCAKAASGAPVPNANVSVSLVDPSTGVPVLVNLNFNPKTTTEGVVKGVYDQLADDLVAHFNGIQMGPSGCFATQQFSFSGASSSLDFDLMFESRGVFASSPLQVSLFTYQDAYRWSISGRWCVSTCTPTNCIRVHSCMGDHRFERWAVGTYPYGFATIAVQQPFLSHSAAHCILEYGAADSRGRGMLPDSCGVVQALLCSLVACLVSVRRSWTQTPTMISCVAAFVGADGYLRFWPQWRDLTSFFPSDSTDPIMVLNASFMAVLGVSMALLLGIWVSTLLTWFRQRRKSHAADDTGYVDNPMSQRNLLPTASGKPVPQLPSQPPKPGDAGHGPSRTGDIGFFSRKRADLLLYAQQVCPRGNTSLCWLTPSGWQLTPAMHDGLEHVFTKLGGDGMSDGDAEGEIVGRLCDQHRLPCRWVQGP